MMSGTHHCVMSIDVGYSMGVARWNLRTVQGVVVATLLDARTFHAKKRGSFSFEEIVSDLLDKFRIGTVTLDELVLEMPEDYKAAELDSVTLPRLAFLAGAITGMAHMMAVPSNIITPSQWKGQLPKKVVDRRTEQRLGFTFRAIKRTSTHSRDAIGLGVYWIEKIHAARLGYITVKFELK